LNRKSIKDINVEEAIFRPAELFKIPSEVLKATQFSTQDKILILRTWRYDVLLEEVAMEENMPEASGNHPDLLQDIDKALLELGAASEEGHGTPTKFG